MSPILGQSHSFQLWWMWHSFCISLSLFNFLSGKFDCKCVTPIVLEMLHILPSDIPKDVRWQFAVKECLRDILSFGLESRVGIRFQSLWMNCSEWTMDWSSFCQPPLNSCLAYVIITVETFEYEQKFNRAQQMMKAGTK